MARVKGGILPGVVGKIGPIVVKNRQGTLYVASRPADFHMSMESEEVEKRNKFSVNSQFSGLVNENKYLYSIWARSDLTPKMIYNKITHINFHLCGSGRPTKNNVITPPGGFPIEVDKLEHYPDKVLAEFQPVSLNENEERIIFLLYICLYNPVKPESDYFDFIQIKEGKTETSGITFKLNPNEQNIAAKYYNQILYLCAVTLDRNNTVIRHSVTKAVDLGEQIEAEFR